MNKMVLLPYDRYQRLLSHVTKPDTSEHISDNIQRKTENNQLVQVDHQHEEVQTEDPAIKVKESPQPSPPQIEQTGQGAIPPPPGIPVKRKHTSSPVKKIKWLKL